MLNEREKDTATNSTDPETATRPQTTPLTVFDDEYLQQQEKIVAKAERDDWLVDEQGRQSFPASDPPGNY